MAVNTFTQDLRGYIEDNLDAVTDRDAMLDSISKSLLYGDQVQEFISFLSDPETLRFFVSAVTGDGIGDGTGTRRFSLTCPVEFNLPSKYYQYLTEEDLNDDVRVAARSTLIETHLNTTYGNWFIGYTGGVEIDSINFGIKSMNLVSPYKFKIDLELFLAPDDRP